MADRSCSDRIDITKDGLMNFEFRQRLAQFPVAGTLNNRNCGFSRTVQFRMQGKSTYGNRDEYFYFSTAKRVFPDSPMVQL